MENKSGLAPLGRAVLIKEYQPERSGSMIAIPEFVKERSVALETRAVVVAVGPGCWPDEPARASPGDKVFISRMAGFVARGTADGEVYRFVNDRDIFAQIVKES